MADVVASLARWDKANLVPVDQRANEFRWLERIFAKIFMAMLRIAMGL